jgi:stress-induced morphogen
MDLIPHIKSLLEKNISDSVVKVGDLTGTGDHLDILVVSDEFKGKMLIDQHQMVMDILKVDLSDQLHAVQIKTMTKEKFEKQQTENK